MNVPLMETKRLLLRALREEDTAAYAEMCADPEVMRYLGSDTLSAEDAWRRLAMFVGHWTLRGFGLWAVEDPSGDFVGLVGLHFPHGWPEREIGWALARRSWGQGYALEAATAVRDHAFRDLGWTRLASFIHADNARSIRLAHRLGGRLSGVTNLRGQEVQVYRYEPEVASAG